VGDNSFVTIAYLPPTSDTSLKDDLTTPDQSTQFIHFETRDTSDFNVSKIWDSAASFGNTLTITV
jgi:hypothetical protein